MRREILFDLTRLLERIRRPTASGIDRVQLQYAAFLVALPRAAFCVWHGNELRSVPRPFVRGVVAYLERRWGGASAPARVAVVRETAGRALTRKGVVDALVSAAPKVTATAGVYLNVSHRHLSRIWTAPLGSGAGRQRVVVMLHDLMPVTHPEGFAPALRQEFLVGLRKVTERSDLVVCPSQATADQYRAWADANGLKLPTTSTIGLGVKADHRAARRSERLDTFVFVGTLSERKNVALLAEAWSRLEASGGSPPTLHVVGMDDSGEFSRRFAGLRSVRHWRGANDVQVEALLRTANALLAPSRAEGFGLPVLEALANGLPVLCSDLPAHREAGLGVAEYLPADDVAAWERAIRDYLEPGNTRRREQLERLKRIQIPTWRRRVAELLRAIDALG